MNSIEFPEMNYKHFREKNAKFHIFLLLSIMGGISLITIYDRKFRHNRPEEGLPKIITYISPINIVAEDNHLYFAYKSPLGRSVPCNSHRIFKTLCIVLVWRPISAQMLLLNLISYSRARPPHSAGARRSDRTWQRECRQRGGGGVYRGIALLSLRPSKIMS